MSDSISALTRTSTQGIIQTLPVNKIFFVKTPRGLRVLKFKIPLGIGWEKFHWTLRVLMHYDTAVSPRRLWGRYPWVSGGYVKCALYVLALRDTTLRSCNLREHTLRSHSTWTLYVTAYVKNKISLRKFSLRGTSTLLHSTLTLYVTVYVKHKVYLYVLTLYVITAYVLPLRERSTLLHSTLHSTWQSTLKTSDISTYLHST